MKNRKEKNYFHWTQPGEVEITAPPCNTCKHQTNDITSCLKFPEKKPAEVLNCQAICSQYIPSEENKNSYHTLKGAVFGLCVGDALGVPVEFKSRDYLKKHPVTEMTGFGTHNQPPGTWSDDSSLTFCLMESLTLGYNIDNIAETFCKWLYDSFWTPHGHVFDVGVTTRAAINEIKKGKPPLKAGLTDERSNGNGSLMRILPLAFLFQKKNNSDTRHIIHEVSSITHGHLRSIIACVYYVIFAQYLINGYDLQGSYYNTNRIIRHIYNNNEELAHFSNILNSQLPYQNETNIKSNGYVVSTLESSLWCLFKGASYKETVLNAVNLGEDTDTTAAIAGGLAGIHYGFKNIPKDWIDKIAMKSPILDLINRFYDSLKLK